MTTPPTLSTRHPGDDWTIIATTADDVSDWTNPTAEIRRRSSARAEVMASSEVDGGITFEGSVDLGLDPTDFATGRLVIHVPRSFTATLSDAPHAFIEVKVTSPTLIGKQTVFRAYMPIEDD